MFKKVTIFMTIVAIVFLIACSPNESDNYKNEKSTEKHDASQSIEDILEAEPGTFAGDQYDIDQIKKELKKHDKMDPEEAYGLMLSLVAEDYRPFKKAFDEFDTEHKLSDQPDIATGLDFVPEKLNVAILLDASGSMAAQVPGGVKMDLAKDAVHHFASNLPKEATVSLRVYGHKGSNSRKDKAISCDSNEVIYEANTYDDDRFQQSLDSVKPTGWTPLAAAIQSARDDLSTNSQNARNLVYVVSDGEETCGGDPVKEAKKLNQSDIQAMVNIIGFDVDDKGQIELKQVAEAGGGVYETVNTEEELREFMERERDKIEEAWEDWKNENYGSIAQQNSDKYYELIDLEDEFYKFLIQEEDRLYKILIIMEDMELIDGNSNNVDELIKSRTRNLDNYASSYGNKFNEEIEKDKKRTEKEIEKKSESD
ncbi:vWA domain-containing protein [Desmospora profundinema]|uniref:VWFA domain-containing protein n=1 Tax=Desmospora profundinema TaxID=1571184 RepID=A0ABU1IQG0_9BACL|nr:VWA domain-containing protein [Desmospora profundinema]MDR6227041.1 hypothetical protein [Desmospora profundinema]